jgi:hypothetical protein
MSALLPLPVLLVVRGELAGVVDALGGMDCGLFVPALGVGDVLAPGELLLGTVCDAWSRLRPCPAHCCPFAHWPIRTPRTRRWMRRT